MDRTRARQIASGVAFLAVCAIAVLIVVSQTGGGSGGDTNLEDVGLVEQQLHGIPQHGTVLGDPKAEVRVIEYGDLQCPVCKAFSQSVAPELIDQVVRKGTASYDLRQWPVIGAAPHTQSTIAAKAALAASRAGPLLELRRALLPQPGRRGIGLCHRPFLTAIAKGAGVTDVAQLEPRPRLRPVERRPRADQRGGAETRASKAPRHSWCEGPGGRQTLTVADLRRHQAAIQAVE